MTKNTLNEFTNAVNTVIKEGKIPTSAKIRFVERLDTQVKSDKPNIVSNSASQFATYELSNTSDGLVGVVINGMKNGKFTAKGDITIPAEIKGKPVVGIGYNAFAECNNITSVTIPDTVKVILSGAFQNCKNLAKVNTPKELTEIGNVAFYNCNKLTSFVISSSVKVLGFQAFSYCTNLKNIQIQPGITKIDSYTFSNCSSLTAVNLPNTIKIISNDAFANCQNLTDINIPESVKYIDTNAFANCTKLRSVIIPKSDHVVKIDFGAFEHGVDIIRNDVEDIT